MYRVLIIPNETSDTKEQFAPQSFWSAMLVTWPSSSYTEPIETGHYLGSEDLGGDHMVFGGNGGDVSCFSESLVGGGDGWGLQKIDHQWRVIIRILQNRMGDQVLNSSDAPLPRHPAIDNDQSISEP